MPSVERPAVAILSDIFILRPYLADITSIKTNVSPRGARGTDRDAAKKENAQRTGLRGVRSATGDRALMHNECASGTHKRIKMKNY
jgi:hypothetical protein